MLIIVQEQQHSQRDSPHFAILSPFPSPHPFTFPSSLHLIFLQRQNKYKSLNPKLEIQVILINYPQCE